MANYAQINETNTVVNVVVADEEWVSSQPGTWIEYTDSNPAYIDGTYDSVEGFLPPEVEIIIVLDEETQSQP